jgi:RHS repeat-associated protein
VAVGHSDQGWSLGVEQWRTTSGHEGDRTHVTPPAGGSATTTIVDAHNRVTQLRQYTAAGTPTGAYQATSYGYDRLDRRTTATDPAGNDWTWSYDLRGRLIGSGDPDKGATSRSYDNAGQLLTTTDARNIALARAYDNLGRVSSLWQGAVGTGIKRAEWVYDTLVDGQLSSSTRFDAGNAYTTSVTGYDDGYRPLGVTTNLPAVEGTLAGVYTTTFTYNVDGSPATQVLPAAGGLPAETISTGYDTSGFAISAVGLDTYVADTSYYSFGAPHQQILGAGTTRARLTGTIDEATRRLTETAVHTESQITPGTWDEVRTDGYGHNPAGAVTAITQSLAGVVVSNQCHLYDRLQRLTDAWTTTATTCQAAPSTGVVGGPDPFWTSWTHDEAGNRTGQTRHGLGGAADTSTSYTYPLPGTPQPHSLLTAATTGPGGTSANSYGYDNTGNTIHRTIAGTGQTLAWDPEGHLAGHTIAGQTTGYLYGVDGNRLLRRDPDGSTTAYLGGYEIRKEAVGGLTATRYYTAGGTTIASRDPSRLTWLGGDHHGTAQVTIDANTLDVTSRRMMPYGEPRGSSPAWVNDKGFVGGTVDPTGLTHLGAREYDPLIGRFLSVDPVQDLTDPQQWNGYSYANNNPVTLSDPGGLDPGGGQACDSGYCSNTWGQPRAVDHKPFSSKPGAKTIHDTIEKMGCKHPDTCRHGGFVKRKTFAELNEADQVAVLQETICANYPDYCRAQQQAEANQFYGFLADLALDLLGVTDAKACINGSVSGCFWTALGFIPIGKLKAAGNIGEALIESGRSVPPPHLACALMSFSAETRILMADGTTKPISQVQVGDVVLATEPENGHTSPQTVTAVWIHDDTLVDLKLASGAAITTTDDHPFWNATDHQWQQAQALDPGDQLLTAAGRHVAVKGLHADSSHHGTAYNLTVANLHTYYVLAGDTPVLVHNCGWEAPSISPNRHGQLTNGRYTLDSAGMEPHVNGTPGKSQFGFYVNSGKATLDAAAYADEFGLWVGNKAKVPVSNGIVGYTGNGEPTSWINVYRSDTGFVHGAPGGAP